MTIFTKISATMLFLWVLLGPLKGMDLVVSPSSRVLAEEGDRVTLAVAVSGGVPPYSYEWAKHNRSIVGATSAQLEIPSYTVKDAGAYTVKVVDHIGSVQKALIFVLTYNANARVRRWGANVVPDGLGGIVAVHDGPFNPLVVHANGSVLTWSGTGNASIVPNFTDIIATTSHGGAYYGLKSDGSIVVGGSTNPLFTSVPQNIKAVALACGTEFTVALTVDGTVVAWGNDAYNSLPYMNHDFGQLDVPLGLANIVAIAAGAHHVLALKSDGTVVGWGNNIYKQTTPPAGLSNVVRIAAKGDLSMALKQDGSVVTWGWDGYSGPPPAPPLLTGEIAKLMTTGSATFALDWDGTITSWSRTSGSTLPNDLGRVLDMAYNWAGIALTVDAVFESAPTIDVQPVGGGYYSGNSVTLAVSASGSGQISYQWAKNGTVLPNETNSTLVIDAPGINETGSYTVTVSNEYGDTVSAPALVTINTNIVTDPVNGRRLVRNPGESAVLQISAQSTTPLSFQWVYNGRIIDGATSMSYAIPAVAPANAGYYFVLVSDSYDTVRTAPMFVLSAPDQTRVVSWGATANEGDPSLAGVSDVIDMAVDGSHGLALRRNGGIYAWGGNAHGQINVPAGLGDVVAVAVGIHFSMALKSDGTVVAWGDNSLQQTSIPSGLTGVVGIAAGETHAVALKSDGTAVVWGGGGGWSFPAELNHDLVALAAGRLHTIGLKTDGTVAVLYGTTAQVQGAAGLSNIKAITASVDRSAALSGDGALSVWPLQSDYSMAVPTGLDARKVALGTGKKAVALTADGDVAVWGVLSSGEDSVPVALQRVVDVYAGPFRCWALEDIRPLPMIVAGPESLTVTVGASAAFSVNAVQEPNLFFQWRKNGTALLGAASSSYTIENVQLTDAGNYDVVVTNSAGSTLSAPAALAIDRLAQVINFSVLPDIGFTGASVSLSATTSSGLVVTFVIQSGPASVSGNSLTLTGTGTVTVRATQEGDATYAAATPVDRSFTVTANYASWELANFTAPELADAGISGPNAVYGQDGLSNLVKYALGLEPKVNATSGWPTVTMTATDWVYTYTKPTSVTDVTYAVEVSTNLTTWTTSGVTLTLISTESGVETWQATYPLGSATNAFFRLRVSQ